MSKWIYHSLVITLYVIDELSYDRYHEKAECIYRINSDITLGGQSDKLPFTSDMMGPTLKQDYLEVEEFVRIYTSGGSKLLKKVLNLFRKPAWRTQIQPCLKYSAFRLLPESQNSSQRSKKCRDIGICCSKVFWHCQCRRGNTSNHSGNRIQVTGVSRIFLPTPIFVLTSFSPWTRT